MALHFTGSSKLIRLMMLPLLMKMGILCFSACFFFFYFQVFFFNIFLSSSEEVLESSFFFLVSFFRTIDARENEFGSKIAR